MGGCSGEGRGSRGATVVVREVRVARRRLLFLSPWGLRFCSLAARVVVEGWGQEVEGMEVRGGVEREAEETGAVVEVTGAKGMGGVGAAREVVRGQVEVGRGAREGGEKGEEREGRAGGGRA